LKEYNHTNIVKLIDYEFTEKECFLYFEYIPGKSLKNVLETYGGFSENLIKKNLKNLIEGILFLNKKEIKIKNLKSTNILVELDGNIKITDFLDYKSTIEFYEIYENSNFKNNRNFEKFLNHPFPWMLNNKNNKSIIDICDSQIESLKKDDINICYLGFLMLEMHTGNNIDYLKENFKFYKDGNYENEKIKNKNFEFPKDVSEEFIEMFYIFFDNNVKLKYLEESILNHKFFITAKKSFN